MTRNLIITIAIFSMLVCLFTWTLDLTHIVAECIYCRTQRTIIGILGLVMLIPSIPYVRPYIAYVFGYLGAHVASAQIFLNVRHYNLSLFLLLASCALCWIVFQVCVIHCFPFHYKKQRAEKQMQKRRRRSLQWATPYSKD